MKAKISNRSVYSRCGFTIVEVLVGSLIMLVVILATLTLYTKSNKVSVDQQQLAGLQHDVRAAMYFISRDIKSMGAGLSQQFSGYFFQGENNDNKGGVAIEPDRLRMFGNSDPLRLLIQSIDHGANIVTLQPDQFNLYPYTATAYPADPRGYINRLIIVLPNPDLNNQKGEFGEITSVDLGANQITYDKIVAKVPHDMNLNTGGSAADYVGGTVNFIELKTYWLDVDGSYPGCNVGVDGYLGQPGVLYVSQWNTINNAFEHLALAQNIEDLQFQYLGDMDGDQQLDDNNDDGVIDVNDFENWDEVKHTNKPEIVAGFRSIRILILGKTPNPFISFSGTPAHDVRYIYGKPMIADSPEAEQADNHRRFLLESTANIRNMSLNVYNEGTT